MSERQELRTAKVAGHAAPAHRAWHVAGIALCVLMLGVHAAIGLNSAGLPDFWRDMYWATSIAHGERLPLAGPPIYRLFELGPWWFYLLALPIWATGRIAVASILVQVLAGAKYFLALRIGTRAQDARLGFAFAASLAVAGWSTTAGLFPTHTAVAETAVLLLALAAWRCWNQLSPGNAALLGLAAAACVHAHPTTVLDVLFAGLIILARHRSWRALAMLAVAAGIVILSLLPPWFDRSPVALSARKAVATYAGADIGVDLWTRFPALLKSLTVDGAWTGLLLMTRWSLATVKLAWWLYCACLLFAAAGAWRVCRRNRRLAGLLAGALVLFVVETLFLVLIRPITPIWMIPSTLPPLALATAIGWYGWLCADARVLRAVATGALGVFIALSLAPFGLLLRDIRTVRVAPGMNPFLDVIDSSDRYLSIPVPFYPARRLDRLGGALCDPAVLHGRLAALIERSLGTTVRNACGHWPDLRYGGMDGTGPQVAGLFAWRAAAAGLEPSRVVAGLALYDRIRVIAPASGGRPTRLRRMQVDPDGPAGKVSRLVFDFDARGADVPLLTSRLSAAAPVDASANGARAALVYDDGTAWAYRCVSCAADSHVRWHLEFAGVASATDLVLLLHDGGNSKTGDARVP